MDLDVGFDTVIETMEGSTARNDLAVQVADIILQVKQEVGEEDYLLQQDDLYYEAMMQDELSSMQATHNNINSYFAASAQVPVGRCPGGANDAASLDVFSTPRVCSDMLPEFARFYPDVLIGSEMEQEVVTDYFDSLEETSAEPEPFFNLSSGYVASMNSHEVDHHSADGKGGSEGSEDISEAESRLVMNVQKEKPVKPKRSRKTKSDDVIKRKADAVAVM